MLTTRMAALLMVLSLVVSGCLGDGDDELVNETATNDTMTNEPEDAMEPEVPAEQDATEDEAMQPDDEEAAPTSAPTTIMIEISETGTLSAGAAVWPSGTYVFLPGMERWFAFDQAGVVTAAEVTMTWEPVLPTMETLTLYFGEIEEIEDGERLVEGYQAVTGPSPLTISVTGLDWDQGRYGVAAWYDDSQVATVTLDQAIGISGNVTAVVG